MGFGEAVSTGLRKFATFSGRASRSEFWWFAVFAALASYVLGIVDSAVFGSILPLDASPESNVTVGATITVNIGLLGTVFMLGAFLPVGVRRMHDVGRSGWWWLLLLVPVIGWIAILIFVCDKSQPGANKYGPNPLTGEDDMVDVFA